MNVELHWINLLAELLHWNHEHSLEDNIRECELIFWVSILDSKSIGPFKVNDGTKINTENYCKFLENIFLSGSLNQEA